MLDLMSRFNANVNLGGKTNSIFETCICCGKLTDVRRDTSVDVRACYVEGAGQLATDCYERIYGPSPIRKLMDGSS
ncbi:MAG: hypothetical protein AABX26_02730 [Nanoarchaeota archaeon]